MWVENLTDWGPVLQLETAPALPPPASTAPVYLDWAFQVCGRAGAGVSEAEGHLLIPSSVCCASVSSGEAAAGIIRVASDLSFSHLQQESSYTQHRPRQWLAAHNCTAALCELDPLLGS